MSRLISKRKEEIKHMCAKWVASSMRSFQIVTDPGLKDLVQVCLDVGNLFSTVIFGDKITYSGRDFRSETRIFPEDLLLSDRTVKN